MKKNLHKTLIVLLTIFTLSASAQRYTSEVFSTVNVTPNVIYGNNFTVFPTGVPTAVDLKMDIYEPNGDNFAVRPLVLYFHTGSFIPAVANQNPTGDKADSTAVEMCSQFAKRGYVAASVDYRQGWVPTDPDQDVRTGTLLQAVYRALIDAKACVRYFYENASGANTYKVDTNTIILCGQGTGGYIAMAYATVNKLSEIQLSKFLSNSTNLTYGFQIGMSYVNQAILGDFDGYGGNPAINNPNNHVGYSTKVHFVVNMGGALGDSSWLEAGDVPMVGFHVTNDPYAPYGDGPVYVPTVPPQFVVDVSGSRTVIAKADSLGNNDCFLNAGFTDPYTLAANAHNNNKEGLFPFLRPVPPSAPGEAGPWEWYDSTRLVTYAQLIGLSGSAGTVAYQNGLATNPDMSKTKALAYIDTIQNYANQRIAYCLPLYTGIDKKNLSSEMIKIYPNPVINQFMLNVGGAKIQSLTISDIRGKIIRNMNNINQSQIVVERENISAGLYLLEVKTEKGNITKKIVLE